VLSLEFLHSPYLGKTGGFALMATLKEQLNTLTSLKHRLAVWEALHDHLNENFISKDGQKATKAIRVPDSSVEVVPEETIEDVLQALGDGPISELQRQIAEIENRQVIILEEAKRKS
jgi:hypothetical protein